MKSHVIQALDDQLARGALNAARTDPAEALREMRAAMDAVNDAYAHLAEAERTLEPVSAAFKAIDPAAKNYWEEVDRQLPALRTAQARVKSAQEEVASANRRLAGWNDVVRLQRGAPRTSVGREADALIGELEGSGKFNAMRIVQTIPKTAVAKSAMNWDSVPTRVRDIGAFLVEAITSGFRQPSIMIYRRDQYIAGIDFQIEGSLSKGWDIGHWYWPVDRVLTDMDRPYLYREPRYASLRDALVVSVKQLGDAAYVAARPRGDFARYESVGLKVRSWFNDPDFVGPNAVQEWWDDQVSRLSVNSTPVEWRGSDDSMR